MFLVILGYTDRDAVGLQQGLEMQRKDRASLGLTGLDPSDTCAALFWPNKGCLLRFGVLRGGAWA